MPNIKSAIKRVKKSDKNRSHNVMFKSAMRTSIKNFDAAVTTNDVEGAKETYLVATKKIDKAAGKGLIHKNKASREKSRLTKKLNELQ